VTDEMRITSLGHAGFVVETRASIIVMDPWLSPTGAFDSAWFQYPRNHHLAALVEDKLQDTTRDRYLYVSHEHKDHLDLPFLRSLSTRDFTIVIPHFRRPALRELLAEYGAKDLISCGDGDSVALADGELVLYLDDAELDRDSAIFVSAGGRTFLNINDCKLHDRLPSLADRIGEPDAFACQFSGATWHPTCYDYPDDLYRSISRKKMMSKFEATAKAIEALRPRAYLPSAGPPVFLDPVLADINFEPVSTFPRAPKVIAYLERRLRRSHPLAMPELMPGDVFDVTSGEVVYEAAERVDEDGFESYMHAYIRQYAAFFDARREAYASEEIDDILLRLRDELQRKLAHFTLRERVRRPLYVRFRDRPEKIVRVDFAGGVDVVAALADEDHYVMSAPSWEIARVLDGKLTWEDFSLTFRMRLSREPDIYQTLIQGFLIMEPEDLDHFCARILAIESNQERIVVEAGGSRYSVNRFCPHQGGDLGEGWVEEGRYLVCARHRWRYDLENDGVCETSADTIAAIALDPN
jgi:UDP-MurNAc hydroxylase